MIVVIDYNMGNIGSVKNALKHLGVEAVISNKKAEIEKATHLILPGVGAFDDGVKKLKELGLIEILKIEVLEKKKPFLGICLGMQLLAEEGEENGNHQGLGWIKGKVRRFQVSEEVLRLPHIGWNDVSPKEDSLLFRDTNPQIFYFVHSYFLEPEEKEIISASCEYGERFAAAIQKNNIFGVQFHPEKSQKSGLALLKNFIDIKHA